MNLVEQALDAELSKLATDFFVVFSRFECALKRSGKYAIGDETGFRSRRIAERGDGSIASIC